MDRERLINLAARLGGQTAAALIAIAVHTPNKNKSSLYVGPPQGEVNQQVYFKDRSYQENVAFDPRDVSRNLSGRVRRTSQWPEVITSSPDEVKLLLRNNPDVNQPRDEITLYKVGYSELTKQRATIIGSLLEDRNNDGNPDLLVFELFSGPQVKVRYLENIANAK